MGLFDRRGNDEISATNLPLFLEQLLYSDAERLAMYFNPPTRDSSYYEGMQQMKQSDINNQTINFLKECLSRTK